MIQIKLWWNAVAILSISSNGGGTNLQWAKNWEICAIHFSTLLGGWVHYPKEMYVCIFRDGWLHNYSKWNSMASPNCIGFFLDFRPLCPCMRQFFLSYKSLRPLYHPLLGIIHDIWYVMEFTRIWPFKIKTWDQARTSSSQTSKIHNLFFLSLHIHIERNVIYDPSKS